MSMGALDELETGMFGFVWILAFTSWLCTMITFKYCFIEHMMSKSAWLCGIFLLYSHQSSMHSRNCCESMLHRHKNTRACTELCQTTHLTGGNESTGSTCGHVFGTEREPFPLLPMLYPNPDIKLACPPPQITVLSLYTRSPPIP